MKAAGTAPAPVFVDLGKCRRKGIRRLRRGEGPLMEEVQQAVADLRAAGRLGPTATPVLLVVKQKPRRRFPFDLS